MAESDTEAQFKQEFISRVKASRIATGLKQWQLAKALGIEQDQYKHYEVLSGKGRLLPHHLVGRFCIICRVEPEWLFTGQGQKPLRPPHVIEQEQEAVAPPKRSKRSRAA